ncbi:MAG: DUF11 domain-containing protein [Verrucomicrobia bacterium]|nr:DUF11 domain-containing protein [Verrucomicrobiota bacterium]
MQPANFLSDLAKVFWILAISLGVLQKTLAALPPPEGPGPLTNRVALSPALERLTWVGWGDSLVVNGGFESGDFTGWDRDVPAGKDLRPVDAKVSPTRVFSGNFAAGFLFGQIPGPVGLSQVVTLPPEATGAVLSWVDQIQSNVPHTPPDQTFRVEVQTPDGFPLAILHQLVPSDPRRTPWVRRSANLGAFAGRTIRIAFIESDNVGPVTVYLDEVRLEVSAPPNTTYDVLLSTNATLVATDLLGTTRDPSLALPALQPDTLYRWQVQVTDPDGTRASPVWSFRTGTNGPPAALRWTLPEESMQAFQPVTVELGALSASGFPAGGYSNTVQLATVSTDSRPASLVISEVSPNVGVEFLNGTTAPLDIAGWQVSLYDSTTWPKPRTLFVFPVGSSVAAGKVITLRRGGPAPGGGSTFFTGQALAWNFNNANRVLAVLVQDANGAIVDFFAADQAFPVSIAEPVAVPLAEWIGSPAPRATSGGDVYQRVGSRDRQRASDWLVCADSFGRVNPYGGPLFLPGVTVREMFPAATDRFNDGRWAGTVEPEPAGTNLLFLADDRQGRVGWSGLVDLAPSPVIALELPAELNEGERATATLRLPSAVATNLVIQLESSWPARLPLPATVVFPAGATQVSLPLSVLEDSALQGRQIVTIRLRAPGFARTQGTLSLGDNETARLSLVVPNQLTEAGADGEGIVQVDRAPEVAVWVELTTDPSGQLLLPAGVWIPPGKTQAPFPIRAVNDPVIDGNLAVQITARTGNWTAGSASLLAVDNEDRQLRLTVPGRIRGEAPVQGMVALSGILPSDLEVRLELNTSGILSVPASVRIPAGSTNAVFSLEPATNPPFRGTSLVTVTATAVDFQTAVKWSEVWDETVRALDLEVTDLVLHPGWGRLLAVVAALDATHPNELVVVNPNTGEIERSLSVAADPSALALSDDGTVLWVGSYGEGRVQRVDLTSFSISASFSLDSHWPVQLAARPGRNDSVVVYRAQMNAGNEIALYVNGVRQPMAISPGNLMWMGMTPGNNDRLYVIIPSFTSGVQPQLSEYAITDQGIELRRAGPEVPSLTWAFAEGRLYSVAGNVLDAATLSVLPGIAGLGHSVLTVEPAKGQGFFLRSADSLVHLTRASLSLGTATETITFPNVNPELGVTRLVRWGERGLAFRADSTLYLVDSAFVDPGAATDLQISSVLPTDIQVGREIDWMLTVTNAGPAAATVVTLDGTLPLGWTWVEAEVPGGSGTSVFGGWTASLPPLPAGASTTLRLRLRPNLAGIHPLSARVSLLQRDSVPTNNTVAPQPVIRFDLRPDSRQAIDLAAIDLCYDPERDALWATVSANAAQGQPGRLVRINPETGLITGEFPTGPLPGRLVRSADGKSLFVAVDGEAVIRRFDLPTETWGRTLPLFDYATNTPQAFHRVRDLAVVPGETERLVATWSVRYFENSEDAVYYRTVAFQDGVRLPDEVAEGPMLELAPSGDELVTFTGFLDYRLARHQLSATGLKTLSSTNGVLGGNELRIVGQRIYSNSGRAEDWPNLGRVTTYNVNVLGPVIPLPDQNRLILFDNGGFQTSALLSMKVFDLETGRLIEEIPFGAEFPAASPAVSCGGDRVAFRAHENASPPNRVVILRTSAIPSAPAPADIQTHLTLTTPAISIREDSEFRLTITNAGPGLAPRVHYSLAWLGNYLLLEASRGTVTHDYYTGLRGQVDQLAPGETVEVRFRFRAGDMGRFPATASAYSSAPDPLPGNEFVTRYVSVGSIPGFGQSVSLNVFQSALAADPAGRRLFLAAADGVVEVDPALGRINPESRFGPAPGALAVSADGQSLWVAYDAERTIRRFRLSDGVLLQEVRSLPGEQPIRHLVAHPFNSQVAACAVELQVLAIGPTGVKPIHSRETTRSITAVNFAPDGTVVVARESYEDFQRRHPIERVDLEGTLLGTSPREAVTGSLRHLGLKTYLDDGRVNEALTLAVSPDLAVSGSPIPLPAARRVAFIGNRTGAWSVQVADVEGSVPTVTNRLGGFLGTVDPTSGVAWGVDGLAFRSERALVLTRLADLPTPIDRDFDGDGLGDIWELLNQLNPNVAADAMEDPDQDGMSTYDEFVAGTDHLRADSVLKLREVVLRDGGLQLRFEGALGRRYQLEGAARLGAPWEPVGAPVSGDGTTIELLVPIPAGADTLIYRVGVQPD